VDEAGEVDVEDDEPEDCLREVLLVGIGGGGRRGVAIASGFW
jgi:hypothetical protein